MITTLPCIPSPFLELRVFGIQPPTPHYYTRLIERQREMDRDSERRIKLLVRMKAIITLADVIDALEAA